MATIFARLINQWKLKNQIFSASFYKIKEEEQLSDETELLINLNSSHNLTESDNKDIDVESQLEQQIQNQETQESEWNFDKINSMSITFYKTGDLNGSSYVKLLLRSSALISIKNDDKYCFLWSILAYIRPCEKYHVNRVSNYLQSSNELNIEGFDFTKGLKCSDVHNFERVISLSINIFELDFYQDIN